MPIFSKAYTIHSSNQIMVAHFNTIRTLYMLITNLVVQSNLQGIALSFCVLERVKANGCGN
jgi:hypothetical protein